MISERQQDEASLYVLGALPEGEKTAFEAALRADPELRGLVLSLERTVEMVARALPPVSPPPELRDRVLSRALAGANPPASLAVSGAAAPAPPALSSFYYVAATDPSGWKELPIRGAFLKLLSADRERGSAPK